MMIIMPPSRFQILNLRKLLIILLAALVNSRNEVMSMWRKPMYYQFQTDRTHPVEIEHILMLNLFLHRSR